MTQAQAFSILKLGGNVFLTGEPGSGKTYVVNKYVEYLRNRGIEPAITASTGIAATHIGGMTIHSWSGIGIKSKLDKRDLKKITTTKYVVKRVLRSRVLIIDEVSMLNPETLSMVDAICREIKQNSNPFGGMQIILVGDFFQLPPIMRDIGEEEAQGTLIEEPEARFAYGSPAWTRANPTVCYLTEQFRQDDVDFLSVLSSIRRNAFGDNQLRYIETRKTESHLAPSDIPKLFSHNANVDRVNDEILDKLPGKARVFNMSSSGLDALASALKRGCLSPEMLFLKKGAVVIFTKNNQKEGFVNGTLGIVEGFNDLNDYPIVRMRDGRAIEVEPMEWDFEEQGKVRASIEQVPLRLAWAITIHKSQGMSLDEAVVDLSNVFEFGQGYVALSRVRRLSGLHILGWNKRAFQVHPEVAEKDAEFLEQSELAESKFSSMPADKIKAMQESFAAGFKAKPLHKRKSPRRGRAPQGSFS
ncbi:MAG: hypothetical protein A3A08_01680 [Candidatus Nealsonbacteria bacterium RIFCSPLOWO2_01_FULL_41_9]|uniref:AAA+ ATPase domain-containing protein n=1 Tax=Candidatus Nealsonbacteria bacterium RIFCSPLOWO2_01_FULL_41_9 TaxID=1801671 RepID=A0A1G2EDL4_9BACT|nr:MAG: hypothetical protein A3A08_01680 [Candidatus Nealsonbacteria bacterium RIFCSPLOWO2_01_FULL_41_9]